MTLPVPTTNFVSCIQFFVSGGSTEAAKFDQACLGTKLEIRHSKISNNFLILLFVLLSFQKEFYIVEIFLRANKIGNEQRWEVVFIIKGDSFQTCGRAVYKSRHSLGTNAK